MIQELPTTFLQLINLEILHLENNDISYIDGKILDMEKLINIHLANNNKKLKSSLLKYKASRRQKIDLLGN
jgi:Leucine-rich repeat (LRR) protein